jgi:predicted AlkP superfamily pyrophosphatase or phosphodiesterase
VGAFLTLTLLVLLFWLLAGATVDTQPSVRPTVILVSLDGWRWDYQARYGAPNLDRLAARGVRAENLIPSFPTKTFPNHYTLVTGLYPGHHGVVSNNMIDRATGRRFSLANRREVQDPMWWGGEPIWVRLQNAGQIAAAMFWPGTEAPIQGQHPRYWSPYDERVSAADRVDRVLRWLDLPANERPTFITLYFEQLDLAAHNFGPDSREAIAAIRRLDGQIGRLLRGLERRSLLDRVNVVVTSDHGLAETSTARVVVLDDYISLDDVEIVDLNPMLALYPRAGRDAAVYAALVKAHPRLRVYRKAETPERWRYRAHPRIPPIVGVVDEGWQILRKATLAERIARHQFGPRGEHGYDPEAMSMRGIFVAAGPAFKAGVTVPAFENVHVYNALVAALGLTPAPNDGDPAIARRLLR